MAHQEFLTRPVANYYDKIMAGGCFVDVKSRFDMAELQRGGLTVWRL